MSPIKDFCLAYEALNEEGTFSQGDSIAGTVTFTLTEDTKVKGLVVKAKGDARVHWSEGTGDKRRSYNAHRRYFKLKQYLIEEHGTDLPQGVHRFKFILKLPQGEMPSSFKGFYGKIVYMLEAKMSRSWRWPTGEQKELKFASKSLYPHPGQQVMCPQSGSVDKKLGVFSKGQVQMSATLNTKICSPGDTLSVAVKICNSSSKKMTPKFSLQEVTVFRAQASRKHSHKSLCKVVGETIEPNSEETVSCQVQIPADIVYSIHNCDIISVEHNLKVYLDISFSMDPEVVFPLVIVPSSFATFPPGGAVGPYPAVAPGAPSFSDFPPPAVSMGPYPAGPPGAPSFSNFPPPAVSMGPYPAGAPGAPSFSDFPPPAASVGPYPPGAPSYSDLPPPAYPTAPYPVPAGPGAYGYPAPVPTQQGNTASGYNTYGFPNAASSAVQPPAPTAPPLFQQEEEPPSYSSLFLPGEDPLGRTGLDQKS